MAALIANILISASGAGEELPQCEAIVLPTELKHRIEADFSSWKIQDPKSLSSRATERWHDEKPLGCPGIATGRLENNIQTSYALLVVPKSNSDSAYKLLLFTPNPAHPADALKIVDEWDKGGAANNFISRDSNQQGLQSRGD